MMMDKRLLIFHQGALGDLVTLFPVIIHLRSHYQAIDLICKNQIGRLAHHLELVDNAYPVESAIFFSLFSDGPVPERLAFLSYYDTILLFSYSTELHQRVGSLATASVHLIPPRPAPGRRRHVTDHYTEHLKEASICLPAADRRARPAYPDWRRSVFKPRRVLIHPGSGSRLKNWPVENFLSLGEQLATAGFETTFLLGPADDHLAVAQFPCVGRPPDLVTLAESLKNAGGFIGNDSGVSHLAAFLGLPTVTLFGPSDPLRWAPRGRATVVVQSAEGCDPCFENNSRSCQSMDCLERISPATVMASFHNLHSG